MNKLSKVALFVYNRPEHTLKVLTNLKKNYLSGQSDIYIFSDNFKNKNDKVYVNDVRNIIQNFKGFKSKRIFYRKKNFGLAKNFICGINQVFKYDDRIIVLEDDNLTSPYFLKYMNYNLDLYKNIDNVGSISGYCYDLKTKDEKTFLSTFIPSWGWGTWKRSWKNYNLNGKDLYLNIRKLKKEREFNLDNSYDFMRILKNQVTGKNNSWSIRWYASLFLKKKYCVFNTQSYVNNIGFDSSGTHTASTNVYKVNLSKKFYKHKIKSINDNLIYQKKLRTFFKRLSKKQIIINYKLSLTSKLKSFFKQT